MDEFVIRLRPKHLERLLFVAIIVILLSVVVWQRTALPVAGATVSEPITAAVTAPKESTTVSEVKEVVTPVEEVVEEIKDTEPVVEVAVTEEPVAEPVVEEVASETETVESTEPKALSGKRSFTLTDIEASIKNEDNDWAKLDSFKLKIENGLAGVYITYKVYIYNVGDSMSDFPDQTVTLPKIEEDEIYESVQNWGGESFNDISGDKKLKIIFVDSTGKELDIKIATFKAS